MNEHDFIIIDTPPAFNLFTVNAWNVSDSVIMPFLPGPMVGMDIARTLKDFQEFDVDIQVIFNQVDRKQKSVQRAVNFLEKQFRTPYFQGVQIPRSPLVAHAMAHRQPVFDRHPPRARWTGLPPTHHAVLRCPHRHQLTRSKTQPGTWLVLRSVIPSSRQDKSSRNGKEACGRSG